ncbi:MAG: hypothetical protein WC763_00575 [Candidatus Paceibacterota bacterium]
MMTSSLESTVHIGRIIDGFMPCLESLFKAPDQPAREVHDELSLPSTAGNPSQQLRDLLGHPGKHNKQHKTRKAA